MQAIQTKYLPATNTKPSRVKATCERGSFTTSWDHGGDALPKPTIAQPVMKTKLTITRYVTANEKKEFTVTCDSLEHAQRFEGAQMEIIRTCLAKDALRIEMQIILALWKRGEAVFNEVCQAHGNAPRIRRNATHYSHRLASSHTRTPWRAQKVLGQDLGSTAQRQAPSPQSAQENNSVLVHWPFPDFPTLGTTFTVCGRTEQGLLLLPSHLA